MPDKAAAKVSKDAGNVEFKAGRYENAIKCYDTAIELDPEEAMYPSNRAMVYLKMCKWNEAEEDCTTALKIDPELAKVYFHPGRNPFTEVGLIGWTLLHCTDTHKVK